VHVLLPEHLQARPYAERLLVADEVLCSVVRPMEKAPVTDPSLTLPIVTLIESRRLEGGINRAELVHRMGYKNVSKGLRRLDQFYEGRLDQWRQLVQPLARALSVESDVVARAMAETEAEIREVNEAERRATFRPHAIILAEHRANSMTMAAIAGADRRLRIDFDPSTLPIKYAQEARAETSRRKDDFLLNHFYGSPTGFIVNFSHDYAVRFELDGSPLAAFERAFEPGHISISIGGTPLTQGQFDLVMGREMPTS
jgi:hypothetical protein